MVAYLFTIAVVTVLLVSAVILNISLCGHSFKNRRRARSREANELHDLIFG